MARDLLLREAEEQDAAVLVDFLNQVGCETDFMTIDEAGILMTADQMADFIRSQAASANQLYLVAFLDEEVAGVLSITADYRERLAHIGDLFMVVKRAYWNHGLGRILLEEAISWASSIGVLRRLQLTVQVRNQAAVHLYQSVGFVIEGQQERGAKLDDGTFVPIYLMGLLID